MRKSRFTEAQIIGMIKEQEAGLATIEVCRKFLPAFENSTRWAVDGKWLKWPLISIPFSQGADPE